MTFRLFDSLPMPVLRSWRQELAIPVDAPATDPRVVDLRERIAKYEDAGHGECFLRDERVAALVENALLHFDGDRYRLLHWCVMPNHVHALIETGEGWPLGDVAHSWKSFTSKEANKILGRRGEFWMADYFDRYIRDETHFRATVDYIERNPVVAGLCARSEDWRFSSAWKGWRRTAC